MVRLLDKKYTSYFAKVEYSNETCMWVTKNARIPVAAYALCEDGKRRAVRMCQQASNAFAHPGRCSFYSKTLRGYLTTDEGVLKFILYNESKVKLRKELCERVGSMPWLSITNPATV